MKYWKGRKETKKKKTMNYNRNKKKLIRTESRRNITTRRIFIIRIIRRSRRRTSQKKKHLKKGCLGENICKIAEIWPFLVSLQQTKNQQKTTNQKQNKTKFRWDGALRAPPHPKPPKTQTNTKKTKTNPPKRNKPKEALVDVIWPFGPSHLNLNLPKPQPKIRNQKNAVFLLLFFCSRSCDCLGGASPPPRPLFPSSSLFSLFSSFLFFSLLFSSFLFFSRLFSSFLPSSFYFASFLFFSSLSNSSLVFSLLLSSPSSHLVLLLCD